MFVDSLVLMLESGGVSLEDIRELKYEEGLMKLLGETKIPSPDALGGWLERRGKDSTGLCGLDKVREQINHRSLG